MNNISKNIAVVILSHNTSDMAINCINSIRLNTTYQNYDIVLVENGSDPEHKNLLKEKFDNDSIKFVDSPVNTGYAGGVNLGLKKALQGNYDYFILLNDDTIINQPDWMEQLIKTFTDIPNAGMVSPLTDYAANPLQDIKYFGGKTHGRLMESHDLIFVCVMIPRKVVEQIGLLDDQFHIGGYEDNDYSLRIRKEGYNLVVNGKVFIHHIGSVANNKLKEKGVNYWENLKKNKALFEKKWSLVDYDLPGWRKKYFDTSNVGKFLDKPEVV